MRRIKKNNLVFYVSIEKNYDIYSNLHYILFYCFPFLFYRETLLMAITFVKVSSYTLFKI